jgi:hypothetical protein
LDMERRTSAGAAARMFATSVYHPARSAVHTFG